MNELSQREGVAAAVAAAAFLTLAWAHWAVVPKQQVVGWVVVMLVLLVPRLLIARKRFGLDASADNPTHWCKIRVVSGLVYGVGWGAMLFVLDTGRFDSMFMLKFAALAAAEGVTVNGLGLLMPVYFGFIGPLFLATVYYVVMCTPFLETDARLSLLIGVAVYTGLLVMATRSVSVLTRKALEQGFDRDDALRAAQESHQRETALREQLEKESAGLAEANRRLNTLARQDVLTGIFNRRHLLEELKRNTNALQRYESEFALIMLDVDFFKRINDTYGHQVGDQVLVGLVHEISGILRDNDIFGRWGGEEFLCILPNTSYADALGCAERLCLALARAKLVDSCPDLVVTASFGVVSAVEGEGVDAMVNRADDALYKAKQSGRNCVCGVPAAG